MARPSKEGRREGRKGQLVRFVLKAHFPSTRLRLTFVDGEKNVPIRTESDACNVLPVLETESPRLVAVGREGGREGRTSKVSSDFLRSLLPC